MGKEVRQKTEIPQITAQEQEFRNVMADIFFNMFGGGRWKVKTAQKQIQSAGGMGRAPQPLLNPQRTGLTPPTQSSAVSSSKTNLM